MAGAVTPMSPQRKSKHHLDTLYQYRWTPRKEWIATLPDGVRPYDLINRKGDDTRPANQGWSLSRTIFVPHPDPQAMRATDGWKVARTKGTNNGKKGNYYPWCIYDSKGKILRHPQSNRIMRFSCPANAIIRAEKIAAKRFATAFLNMKNH